MSKAGSMAWSATVGVILGPGLVAGVLAAASPAPAVAVLGSVGALEPTLEARAGQGDEAALLDLADQWVRLGAPGLAAAALSRLAPEARSRPEVALVRARVLAAQGRAGVALDVARDAVRGCELQACDAELLAAASRQSGWLVALAFHDALDRPARVRGVRVGVR